jgi:hypothetical protein
MKTMVRILILSIFGMLAVSPLPVYAAKIFKSEVIKKSGDNLYVFHSVKQDVKNEFCLNDVIPVYREVAYGWPIRGYGEVKTRNEVGEIKILSYLGDHDIQAQVVDGSVQVGDVAEKEGSYCPVLPAK